jgi:nitroreductase
VSALHLADPRPSAHELRRMLTIAARVPDHGALAPWRFILVEGAARETPANRLADACLAAADQNEKGANEQALRTAQNLRVLFGHPPLVVVVVSRPDPASRIPVWEQTLSAGAACMNLITAATALGYGANWLTGWAATHPAARPVLGLSEAEGVVGIIPIGTATERPPERPRPDLGAIVSAWAE